MAWIDLQVVPVHYLRYRSARMPLHQCLEQLDYYNQTHPHFEFFLVSPHRQGTCEKWLDRPESLPMPDRTWFAWKTWADFLRVRGRGWAARGVFE
ncbi:hypothetical protein [Laceyella sacchari]|uniref:Uncharacterized protein n=1 Tax=Laceyella sacchari TaxID=37482 RepID=A0ABY5U8H6_LACSH|nr:hypothetical protein [Laceyella sacchari]UWE04338.1 hypothetical protein NYR52_04060 [Laceyella sacchari]